MAKKNETQASTEATEVQGAGALVVQQAGALAAPDFMNDMDFGAGAGFEGADADSFAIPFLTVLQKMSPQVDEDHAKYIDGAKAGMLYNTVTGKVYDGKIGVVIIPAAFKRSFILWGGREGDGGFKGEFTVDQFEALKADPANRIVEHEGRAYVSDEKGQFDSKKSDYYADTRCHFVVVIDPETGEYGNAMISLSSSQIKSSKMLMTSLQQKKVKTARGMLTPPTYANMVRLTTVGQSNDKGSWSVMQFAIEGMVTDVNLFNEAREFYNAVSKGEVVVDHSKNEPSTQAADVTDKPQEAETF